MYFVYIYVNTGILHCSNAIIPCINFLGGVIYDGNYWWASKEMENGQTIISYINQTPGNTTIASNRMNQEWC